MRRSFAFLSAILISAMAVSQTVRADGKRLTATELGGTLVLQAPSDDLLRIDFRPNGVSAVPTETMDPRGLRTARPVGISDGNEIVTSAMHVVLGPDVITVAKSNGERVATIELASLAEGRVRIHYTVGENLYGMRGNGLFGARDPRTALARGLLRNDGATVAAGAQGDGGAPLAYSTHWGVLVDSVDGKFSTEEGVLEFSHGSRKDVEAYFVIGAPKRSIQLIAALTGHPAMPPKWAVGFMNSQWGTDEKSVLDIVAEYRRRKIPLDAFIFDFDFKAWGEDNYGEWRWNSTNGPGNVGPMKYPNGQNGKFAKAMADRGVHLVGIMKPRILTQTVDLKPTKASAEADAHHWWMPNKRPYEDYFSHRLANDFDFSKPEVRKWYWQHSKNLFDTGISGWWNDEADDGFDSLAFLHMQQSLFDGQQSVSNRRVWSLNRNFYLGAQRFAFGTWSGDIRSGFASMAAQETRMLDLIDLGQSQWSMDAGGFGGHPDPENFARWMEFAAVVPIMRVHGTYGERRQPWLYGDVAELAASKAIRWRYAMLPSFYSWERQANRTGIGIVRPLFWEFPNDPGSANVVDAWMLGDGLLVSPVMTKGETSKRVYLPPGRWYELGSDRPYEGGDSVEVQTDSILWSDIPMFARSGAILASQPVLQFVSERPVETITLDVWPDDHRRAGFEVYDDDGETRHYEHGDYFSQHVEAWRDQKGVTVDLDEPDGIFRTSIKHYRIRVHGGTALGIKWNGFDVTGTQSKGVAEVEIPAGLPGRLTLPYNPL
ncbi:MAG: glycoside hydrolase family 31 protein [Fimbriimonas sp.]|nr:glycoside hydrolase family 31 protein [Fimbriimonas sp.]